MGECGGRYGKMCWDVGKARGDVGMCVGVWG